MVWLQIQSGMAHYYCRWCREHEFYSDGRLQTPDYAVAKAGNEDYYWEWV
jgi:hypothetical protein